MPPIIEKLRNLSPPRSGDDVADPVLKSSYV
jgi:hypothetical protein